MFKTKVLLVATIFCALLISSTYNFILAAGICYTGCNALWVACVAAAGGIAGVTTGGIGVPAAILACNAA